MNIEDITEKESHLIAAVMNGHLNSVKKLTPECDLDKIGILALRQALIHDEIEIVEYLIKKGAPAATTLYNSAYAGTKFEVETLLDLVKFTTTEVTQACSLAIINGHTEIIKQLFEYDPGIRAYGNYFHRTALKNKPEIINFLNDFCQKDSKNISINPFKHLH